MPPKEKSEWQKMIDDVRKKNPNLTFAECLPIASKYYSMLDLSKDAKKKVLKIVREKNSAKDLLTIIDNLGYGIYQNNDKKIILYPKGANLEKMTKGGSIFDDIQNTFNDAFKGAIPGGSFIDELHADYPMFAGNFWDDFSDGFMSVINTGADVVGKILPIAEKVMPYIMPLLGASLEKKPHKKILVCPANCDPKKVGGLSWDGFVEGVKKYGPMAFGALALYNVGDSLHNEYFGHGKAKKHAKLSGHDLAVLSSYNNIKSFS
jgi:hypothetical protein